MSDFNVRSDSVDVEQIMRQIRARIREKRGADYTEAELQQLATVKLERFLDPRGLRSDLVDQFRRHRTVSPEPPKYEFEDTTLYDTHRGALRAIRRLLHPILKLFLNPNPLIHALHVQKQVNDEFHKRFRAREEMDPLFFEVIHNLVVEITRLGIEVQNLKMRVESMSSRLDFDERRARSLESVVEYRRPPRSAGPPGAQVQPGAQAHAGPPPGRPPGPPAPAAAPGAQGQTALGGQQGSPGQGDRHRRRRRRRRRPGRTMAERTGPGGDPNHTADDSGGGGASFADRDDAGGNDDGGNGGSMGPEGSGAADQ
jgi:hypothetical protein